jgi:uncharacterized protein YkwD
MLPSMPARLLKLALLVAVLTVLVAVATPGVATPSRGPRPVALTRLEAGVLQQLNRVRLRHGLVPLRLSADLTAASAQHSREMEAKGYFEHNSADGTAFWQRIGRWYGSGVHGSWSVGENILWSSPGVDPASARVLWMGSPEHRRNILNPAWREIGIAALHVASAPGAYDHRAVTIVTTDFGVRR